MSKERLPIFDSDLADKNGCSEARLKEEWKSLEVALQLLIPELEKDIPDPGFYYNGRNFDYFNIRIWLKFNYKFKFGTVEILNLIEDLKTNRKNYLSYIRMKWVSYVKLFTKDRAYTRSVDTTLSYDFTNHTSRRLVKPKNFKINSKCSIAMRYAPPTFNATHNRLLISSDTRFNDEPTVFPVSRINWEKKIVRWRPGPAHFRTDLLDDVQYHSLIRLSKGELVVTQCRLLYFMDYGTWAAIVKVREKKR